MKPPGSIKSNLLVFFTAFTVLGYEISFTQVFAYAQWHNFSSLIITMAMLGFGASGAIIAVFQERISANLHQYLSRAAALFPMSLCMGFLISVRLEFNPYEISFNPNQVLNLFLYFSLMAISFFLGAAVLCMVLLHYRISFTYFVNLIGSAAGVVFVLCASFFLHPYDVMILVILISFIPAGLSALTKSRLHGKKVGTSILFVLIILALIVSRQTIVPRQVSMYKPVSAALTLPQAKVVHEAYSPRGVVQVVQAQGLRSTAGLSLISPFQVPEQKAIFYNGEGTSAITPYSGRFEEVEYLTYLTSYLPFILVDTKDPKSALIIGSGGGESILKSLMAGFNTIDALEADRNVIHLMSHDFARFSGGIYTLDSVNVIHGDARHFIKQTRNRYDLIELSLVDAYNASASGVYGLNECYLYTVESMMEYFRSLTDTGMLALTRWVVTPARDNLKLFATVVEALNRMGIPHVETHLIAIRSLQTLTLVVLKQPAGDDLKRSAISFAQTRGFDLVHYPGMKEAWANRHIRLTTPVYYRAVKQLTGADSGSFINAYSFDIRPPTDNRPYFYNFFKAPVIDLIRTFGPSQVPVTEWGHLQLLIILVPVLGVSALSILLPLVRFKNIPGRWSVPVLFYFALIGSGFFFTEMVLIQKMVLFLGHPLYAVSAMIAILLMSAGTGSYVSDRIFPPGLRLVWAAALVSLIIAIYSALLDPLFRELIHLKFSMRLVVAILMTAPLGFFMGIFFPAGLSLARERHASLAAWAWGVNGFFSVISILSATLLSVLMGFKAVLTAAAVFYLLAGIISLTWTKRVNPAHPV